MGLILRLVKGTALTWAELDANFTYLLSLITGFVSVEDITNLAFRNKKNTSILETGRFYRVTDKGNILLQAISPNDFIQLSKNRSILELIANTPYTWIYAYEQYNTFAGSGLTVYPKIFAVDADGEPVAVKVTGITSTQMTLTSAVDCTVRISI